MANITICRLSCPTIAYDRGLLMMPTRAVFIDLGNHGVYDGSLVGISRTPPPFDGFLLLLGPGVIFPNFGGGSVPGLN